MIEEQRKQFFAMKSEEPHKVRVGGKFGFNSLPSNTQEVIKKRLAEKDNVMTKSINGALPGIKIDGKQVTKENLHEFEKKSDEKPKEVKEKVAKELKYNLTELEKLSFSKLKKLAKTLGETGRSKGGLIKDILKHN